MTKSTTADMMASFNRIRSLAGGAAGLVAGVVSAATVAVIRDAASAIASIGDEARRAGLDVKSFQELKYVAEQNRIGVDALTDGIKELNLRADEFIVTGGGSAAEAFKRLGLEADDLKRKLKDPSALFTEIIGKLQQFDKAAQIRILDEVFGGTGGEQFVQLIQKGEAGIRDTIRAANDLGIVLDEQMIQQAEEVDRKFNAIATTVGTNLKAAIVSVVGSMGQFIDSFNDIQNQQTNTLAARQTELLGKRNDIAQQIREARQDREAMGEYGAKGILDEQITQLEGYLDQLGAEEDRIIAILSERNSPKAVPPGEKWTPPVITPDDTKKGKGGGGGRSKAATDAEKEAKAIDQVIASLREELSVIGLTDIERERTLALREAGVTATSKEGQQISDLIDQKYRQLAAEDALIDQQERLRDGAERMGAALDDQLSRIIDGTFDAKDAIAALLTEIINVNTNGKGLFGSIFSALSGGFGGSNSGLFSSSFVPNTTLGGVLGFGGARAGGGDVSPGRIYRVNEYEDEFMVPTNHGRIIAPSKLQGAGSGEAADGGRSVVQIELSEDLVAKILQQASGQTVQLMKRNEAALANVRQNGGDY